MQRETSDKAVEADERGGKQVERGADDSAGKGREESGKSAQTPEPAVRERGRGGMDFGL